YEESESRLDRVSFGREIGTVQWIAHLQPQRVARAQATGPDSKRLPLFKHSAPKLHRVFCGKKNFNAVLARITGASDGNVGCAKGNINNVISCWQLDICTEKCMEQCHDLRALDGHCAKIRAATC